MPLQNSYVKKLIDKFLKLTQRIKKNMKSQKSKGACYLIGYKTL